MLPYHSDLVFFFKCIFYIKQVAVEYKLRAIVAVCLESEVILLCGFNGILGGF